MSYCVNCGVELEHSLKKCPLCGVVVVNPLHVEDPEHPPVFPESRDELKKKDRMFWVGFFSLLYIVPIVTCVICNLLYDKALTWSVIVAASVLMIWVYTTSPFYFPQFNYRKMLGADYAATLLGLLIIQKIAGGGDWFIRIALPVVTFCFAVVFVFILLTEKKKLRGLGIAAAYTAAGAVLAVFIELLIDLYTTGIVDPFWSWFVIAPCLSIAALLVLLEKNKHFKQELAKRLHV